MLALLLSLAMLGCADDKNAETGGIGETGEERVVDADRDGSPESEDCDDQDPGVGPEAEEICDGVDNDCDGLVDDMDPELVGETWYTDADGDGWGDDGTAVTRCTEPEGAVSEGGDCDDADPAYHPGAEESDCSDANDYNCDGSTGYDDDDGDGFAACEECDDDDPLSYPGAEETCDDADNDCDGLTDDADDEVSGGTTWYTDMDGDGYGDEGAPVVACDQPEGTAAAAGDCDDNDDAFYPGAAETDCTDPSDYNCDGEVDYVDADGDGAAACLDCDDGDAAVNAEATELCDGVDNDCDGLVDDADDSVEADAVWYADGDGDGYGDAAVSQASCEAGEGWVEDATDCDDDDDDVNPGATETCNDEDDDCDGRTDDADSGVSGTSTWYRDADGDGYGASGTTTTACDAPSGYVATAGDCQDGSAAINPAATETCDGRDNDCDGLTDDADSGVSGTSTWYRDADGDGYGASSSGTAAACNRPSGYSAVSTDCDDTDDEISPTADEVCNDEDDDCDGLVDQDDASLTGTLVVYVDADGDGYGDDSSVVELCKVEDGYATEGGDCDDTSEKINPEAEDTCDGVDNDCSDYADDGGDCPCSVEYQDDHPYMFCRSYKTWSSAKSTCEAYGYTLASIDDADEDDWVYEETRSYYRYTWWWIGYTDSASEDTWVWTDGDATTYTNWASGEPDDDYYYGQDCAIYAPSYSDDWYDTYCGYYLYFVCEAE